MTWAALWRRLIERCALLTMLCRQAADDLAFIALRRRRPLQIRVATVTYLLTYAGSVCQWPYEYQFYGQRGLTRRDVYIILGIQQLAVLLGPYLAWLCFQRSTGPIMSPRNTMILCLMATAAACEAKSWGLYRKAAVIVGLGPSLAASLLDLREHVALLRHLQAYVSICAFASAGALVDVFGFGVESLYSLASAFYLAAAVVVCMGLNEMRDVVFFRPQGFVTRSLYGTKALATQDNRAMLDTALQRLAELLEDTQTLTTSTVRFLMDAVGVLNWAVFEVAGPYPCGKTVTSVAAVFLLRQTIQVIAMAFPFILRTGARSDTALKGAGTVICLATFVIGFHSVKLQRSEFCMAHMLLVFGTAVATAGEVTKPWHQSTLSGLLATAVLLWPCVDSHAEFAVATLWMSSLTVMAISTLITGVLVSLCCPTTKGRKRTVIEEGLLMHWR